MPNLISNFPEIIINSRFYIELKLDGSQEPVDAYFMECKGLKHAQEVIEVCEVTPGKWGKANSGYIVRTKVPGNLKTNNITLLRGLTKSTTLSKWFEAVQQGKWATQRKDGSLTIYDQAANPQAIFQFQGAWPVSYIVSDLNSNGTDLEIEEMEIAIEQFTRQQ